MERTDSPVQLAAVYAAANVFFNPTAEDNYPTVNLEAEACGTPVVTYDTGGCRETISLSMSRVIEDLAQGFGVIAEMECVQMCSNSPIEGVE